MDERVLIPRPETEQVVEVALGEIGGWPPPHHGRRRHGFGRHRPLHGHRTGRSLSRGPPLGHRRQRRGAGRGERESGSGAPPARRACPAGHVRAGVLARPASPGVAGRGRPDRLQSSLRRRREWPDLPDEVRREPCGALVAGDGTDGTPGLAGVEEVLSPGLDVAVASRRRGDRTGAAPGRAAAAHGPAHGVRRGPGGEGSGRRPRTLVGRVR